MAMRYRIGSLIEAKRDDRDLWWRVRGGNEHGIIAELVTDGGQLWRCSWRKGDMELIAHNEVQKATFLDPR